MVLICPNILNDILTTDTKLRLKLYTPDCSTYHTNTNIQICYELREKLNESVAPVTGDTWWLVVLNII